MCKNANCFVLECKDATMYLICEALVKLETDSCELHAKRWDTYQTNLMKGYKQMMQEIKCSPEQCKLFSNATCPKDIMDAFNEKFEDSDENFNHFDRVILPIELECEKLVAGVKRFEN